jgi:hypothetical protein
MRRLMTFGAGTVIAIAMTGSASAQVTGILTSQTAHIHSLDVGHQGPTSQLSNFFDSVQGVPNSSAQYGLTTSLGAIQNYQVSTHIDNTQGYIAFANNATAVGYDSIASTTTDVSVTYTNNTGATVNPLLTSTITPGGLGFYMADITQHPLNINEAPESTQPMDYKSGFQNGATLLLGTVSVDFKIISGVTTLADYVAQMDLYEADGGGTTSTVTTFSNSMYTLAGFGLIASDDPQKQVGYGWGATDVILSLGDLADGASNTLSYVTTVSAFSNNQGNATTATLLAYAGFGDPIGQSAGAGGVEDPIFNMMKLGLPTFSPTLQTANGLGFQGYIDPLPIDQITNNADHALLGNGVFTPTYRAPESLDGSFGAIGGVPEPGTWALMLGGFGLAGAALRRRARLA